MHSLVNDVEWLLVVVWGKPSAERRLPVTLASRSAANVVGRGTNHLDCAAGQSHVCAQKREICLKAKFPTFSLHWNIRPQVPDEKFVSKILSCSEVANFYATTKKSAYLSGATSCCWSGLSNTSKFRWSNTSTKATTGSVLEDLDDPRAMTCQKQSYHENNLSCLNRGSARLL